jgi:hypothetical protein
VFFNCYLWKIQPKHHHHQESSIYGKKIFSNPFGPEMSPINGKDCPKRNPRAIIIIIIIIKGSNGVATLGHPNTHGEAASHPIGRFGVAAKATPSVLRWPKSQLYPLGGGLQPSHSWF